MIVGVNEKRYAYEGSTFGLRDEPWSWETTQNATGADRYLRVARAQAEQSSSMQASPITYEPGTWLQIVLPEVCSDVGDPVSGLLAHRAFSGMAYRAFAWAGQWHPTPMGFLRATFERFAGRDLDPYVRGRSTTRHGSWTSGAVIQAGGRRRFVDRGSGAFCRVPSLCVSQLQQGPLERVPFARLGTWSLRCLSRTEITSGIGGRHVPGARVEPSGLVPRTYLPLPDPWIGPLLRRPAACYDGLNRRRDL